eukprot:5083419-Pleurochrysis_carterae.AAC.5
MKLQLTFADFSPVSPPSSMLAAIPRRASLVQSTVTMRGSSSRSNSPSYWRATEYTLPPVHLTFINSMK